VFEGVNGCFANVPRRDEIRLADTEGDDALLTLDDVEEFADAGARNFANDFRYERFAEFRERLSLRTIQD
jgi:hypothetical protein